MFSSVIQRVSGPRLCIRWNHISATIQEYKQKLPTNLCRTSVSNPAEHTPDQIGAYYTIEKEKVAQYFGSDGVSRKHNIMSNLFHETSIMIRQPSLTVIDYIRRSNFQHLPNKFILYGKRGVGKTLCLGHVINYLYEEKFIVVQCYHTWDFVRNFKEITPSAFRENFHDHNQDASKWLQNFRNNNQRLIEEKNLLTTEDHVWNQRETTEAGSPLLSIVDFGIARARYASECTFRLVSELKTLASADRCKVAFAMDGINALFHPRTYFFDTSKVPVGCNKLTFFQGLCQFFQRDWKNGVIVGTTCLKNSLEERQENHYPRYLLRKSGWEAMEPLVPVKVDNYTDNEFHNQVDYLIENKWICRPEALTYGGRKEIEFLTGRNPFEINNVARSL